jgi:hypothetical protein
MVSMVFLLFMCLVLVILDRYRKRDRRIDEFFVFQPRLTSRDSRNEAQGRFAIASSSAEAGVAEPVATVAGVTLDQSSIMGPPLKLTDSECKTIGHHDAGKVLLCWSWIVRCILVIYGIN